MTNRPKFDGTSRFSKEGGLLQALLEAAGSLIVVVTPDHKIQEFSREAERILGYKREEVLGRDYFELFVPADGRKKRIQRLDTVLAGRQVRQFASEVLTRAGEEKSVLWNAAPLFNAQGHIVGAVGIGRDIADRKSAEDALAESEEKFHTLFEASPDAITLNSVEDHRFLEVNNSFLRLTGYKRAEVIGRTSSELGLWGDPAGRERMVAWLTKGARLENEEVVYRTKAGELRIALMSASRIRVREKDCVLGICTDITERKRSENLLSMEKEVLQKIAKGGDLGSILHLLVTLVERQAPGMLCSVLLLDDEKRLRHGAAPSLPESYSRAIDGMSIGLNQGACGTAAHLGKQVIASDIETDPTCAGCRETVLGYGLRACWSTPIFSTKGTVLGTFAMYYTSPRDPSAIELGLISQATQLAGIAIERSRSEAALSQRESLLNAIIEGEPDCVKLLDAEGKVLQMNRAGLEILEADSPDQVVGRCVYPVVAAEYREKFRKMVEGVFRGRSGRLEFEVIGLNGRRRWLETHSVPLREGKKRVRALLGITRDVTERKRDAAELRGMYRRLLNLQEVERGRLARELHDSASQMLAAVTMNLSMVEKSANGMPAASRRAVQESLDLTQKCLLEIRTLTYLLRPPLLDEMGLVPALRWLAQGFAERSGVDVKLELEGRLGRLEPETETTVYRIAQEGLTNVYRHASSRSARLRLVRSGPTLRMEIVDDGSGISARERKKLLNGKGAGVGIAGMRERVEHLGGTLEITSKRNGRRGTQVTAVLPIRRAYEWRPEKS